MKRGFFFTLDAIIAVGIIIGGLVLFSSFNEAKPPVLSMGYMSNDLITAVGDLQFFELGSTAYNIIDNATKPVDTNQSALSVVAELWANNDIFVAEDLAEFILDSNVPPEYGVGIWMDDELIYARTEPVPTTITSARKIISGVAKSSPTKGYVARANALDVIKHTSRIISFSPMGAGWYGNADDPGQALIDKYFDIASGVTISSASLAISLHMHNDDEDWIVVDINNGNCTITRDEISWQQQSFYDIKDVKNCLVNGTNHIRLDLRNTDYNGHVHPGMLLRLDFDESTSIPIYNQEHSERFYFDNITSILSDESDSGVWQLVPFHIPPDATNTSAYIQIVGNNIRDYTSGSKFYSWSWWRKKKDYDYILFVNEDSPFDSDNAPASSETYTYSPAQLASKLVTGTNSVVAYFNNYGDYKWGDDDVQIYSDPVNDPNGSSFVEVNYTISSTVPYGHIEITNITTGAESPGDGETFEDGDLTVMFSFPPSTIMSDVYGHLAQRFSYLVKVEADDYNPPSTSIFESPASRAVPTDIFVPTTTFSNSPADNFIRFSDYNNNKILFDTSIEYSFYLPGFVGYGNLFTTLQGATDDAVVRLQAILEPYITLDNYNVDTSNITGVPTLWGPTIAEVRVWR